MIENKKGKNLFSNCYREAPKLISLPLNRKGDCPNLKEEIDNYKDLARVLRKWENMKATIIHLIQGYSCKEIWTPRDAFKNWENIDNSAVNDNGNTEINARESWKYAVTGFQSDDT